MRRGRVLWILVAVVVLGVSTGSAQGAFEIELVGGVNFPQPEIFDDGVIGAVRIGRTLTRSTAFDVTFGYLGNDLDWGDGDPESATDRDTWFVEVNETLAFNADGRLRPAVSVGIGWAWTDIEPAAVGAADGVDDNSFMANAAFKLEIWAAPNVAVIPALEARWFEGRHDESFDAAATLGVAFRFRP